MKEKTSKKTVTKTNGVKKTAPKKKAQTKNKAVKAKTVQPVEFKEKSIWDKINDWIEKNFRFISK